MSVAEFAAISLATNGAAAGLFLLIAALLLRDRAALPAARIAAALAASAAASAVMSMPGFWAGDGAAWRVPITAMSCGVPAAFWLWARSAFDDEFRLRPWHGLGWVAMGGGGLFVVYGARSWPRLWAAADGAFTAATLVFATLAVLQTLATWRADLVERRRRLRVAVLISTSGCIALEAVAELARLRGVPPGGPNGPTHAIMLCALAALAAWNLFRLAENERRAVLLPTSADTLGDAVAKAPEARLSVADPALLQRLERLMTEARVHREEGLTIGILARRLRVSEQRLRQAINEGLGHRNFNAFLNRFRIEEAKAALVDPAQASVPVLTIALDAGFQSVGPFNRAFKAETGMTPTEFRRVGLSEPGRVQTASWAETSASR